MNELEQLGEQMKRISSKLHEIRMLSKSEEDYFDVPYNDDYELIDLILKEKIEFMVERDKQRH